MSASTKGLSAFTPGPWTYYEGDGTVWPCVQRRGSGGFSIQDSDRRRAEADARLIAAAPELLRMLDALTRENPQGVTSTDIGDLIREAKAVIAKARGESTQANSNTARNP